MRARGRNEMNDVNAKGYNLAFRAWRGCNSQRQVDVVFLATMPSVLLHTLVAAGAHWKTVIEPSLLDSDKSVDKTDAFILCPLGNTPVLTTLPCRRCAKCCVAAGAIS
eukprot:m.915505 g.915505  ORF g.915505 m.915505 type:complete len:108 (+) comp23732_c0_seq74:806-1129(+)